MQHIDEHTLELYVLKAGEIADRIDDIEAHLQECSGCQALVNEMSKFYDDLTVELERMPEAEISPEKALVRRNVHLNPIFERNTPAFRYRPSTPLAKIFYFVRRHPVSVGLGSFALVAAFGWWMNSATDSLSSFFKDKSPHKFDYDPKSDSILVFNKDQQKLWGLQAGKLQVIKDREHKYNTKYTYLDDVDNDGKKELITNVALAYDGSKLPQNILRIYSYKGDLLNEISFYEPFDYLKRDRYNFNFSADPVIIYSSSPNQKKEIFVGAACIGNSPYFIARLNDKGKILGEYWHHGAISGLQLSDVNGDGRDELIAYGLNDTRDTSLTSSMSYGIMAVLYPMKINGYNKSTATPNYKFDPSDAELFYIRFPLIDVNFKFNANSSIEKIEKVDISNYRATLRFTVIPEKTLPPIYFTFSKDLHVLEVAPSDEFNVMHLQWKKQGLLKSQVDEKYKEELKKGVQYWDGKEWQGEWAVVKH